MLPAARDARLEARLRPLQARLHGSARSGGPANLLSRARRFEAVMALVGVGNMGRLGCARRKGRRPPCVKSSHTAQSRKDCGRMRRIGDPRVRGQKRLGTRPRNRGSDAFGASRCEPEGPARGARHRGAGAVAGLRGVLVCSPAFTRLLGMPRGPQDRVKAGLRARAGEERLWMGAQGTIASPCRGRLAFLRGLPIIAGMGLRAARAIASTTCENGVGE